jgi:transcriptional regulator with XRE-family HTH domain
VARRAELADFLRTRRAQLSPTTAGLPADGRRRTPGLRREEVARLAGVGLSWYTWLEQGRDIRPSPQVLDAVARALRLAPAERAHLFHLARVELPLAREPYAREAPAHLRELVAGLDPHPAFLTGPRMDVLAWNRAAAAVLTDFGAAPPERRNLLWWLFAADEGRAIRGWAETARNTLARFRAEHARRVGDPAFAALVEELSAASEAFRAWWPEHQVLTEQAGTKTIPHPALGTLRLHHLQSSPTSDPDLRLTLYVPADAATRAALAPFGAE